MTDSITQYRESLQPKTLADILDLLEAVDQGLVAVTPEKQAELGALLVAKIDNTAEVIQELESQEERLRAAAKKLTDGARQVASRIERIKSYMSFHMQANSFQQIPGEVWKARLNTALAVEPKREPNHVDYAEMPQFVRVKWEWKKKELKDALEALDPAAMEVATLVLSASVSIDVNKGKLLP